LRRFKPTRGSAERPVIFKRLFDVIVLQTHEGFG